MRANSLLSRNDEVNALDQVAQVGLVAAGRSFLRGPAESVYRRHTLVQGSFGPAVLLALLLLPRGILWIAKQTEGLRKIEAAGYGSVSLPFNQRLIDLHTEVPAGFFDMAEHFIARLQGCD